MKRATIGLCTVSVLGSASAVMAAECDQILWCDSFDNYVAGIAVIGQDCVAAGCADDTVGCPSGLGWQAWDFNGSAGASPVSTDQANSGANSVAILGGDGHSGTLSDDLVHTYNNLGLTTGVYQYSGNVYIPNDYSGDSYFILLNQYVGNGTKNWSTQVHFQSSSGNILSDFDDGVQNEVAYETGVWKRLQVVINLDTDAQEISYSDVDGSNSSVIVSKVWANGTGGTTGTTTIEALDLFGNDATIVYWDDLELCTVLPFGACCLQDGSCQDDQLTEQDCAALEDYTSFQGIGSSCGGVSCPVRTADGWAVNPANQPGGPGAEFTFSGDTTQGDFPPRENCDEVGTGSPDEQWVVAIPWTPQDGSGNGVDLPWTFSVCGAAFDSLLTGSLEGPCLITEFGDNECGDDAEFEAAVVEGDAYYLTLEGLTPDDAGAYDLVISGRCPDVTRDPDAIDNDGPVCFDGDTDPVNIGCNGDPGLEGFSTMDANGVYSGTLGNFIFDGGGRRDLDWYRIQPTVDTTLSFAAVGQGPGLLIQTGTLDDRTGEGGSVCYDADGNRTDDGIETASADCAEVASLQLDVVNGGDYFILITYDFNDPENVPCSEASYYQLGVTGFSVECTPGGDVNNDGCVDFADILVILAAWGTGGPDGDADCSGVVDFADILVVLSEWGNGCE